LLFVWPESCIESPLEMDPRHVYQIPSRVRALVRNQPGAALLFGAIGYPRNDQELENGCLLLDSEGNAAWPYSKIRLVPFGETVPFREVVRFLEYPWPGGDISAGRQRQPFNWQGRSLGAMICYDNVFGFIPREQVRQGAQYLFLMTNNSWYKLRSGIRQHCDIDVLRAVECRRPLSRASTTGWSQAIDPAGRILAQTTAGGAGLIQISLLPGPPAGLEPAWLRRLKEPGGAKARPLALLGDPAYAAAAEPAEPPESRAEPTAGQDQPAIERAKEHAAEAEQEPAKERGQPQGSAEIKFSERPRPKPDLSGASKPTLPRPAPSLSADSPYLTLGDLFAQLCVIFSLLLCVPPMLRGRSEGWL
jgi:predicted amidohydrolase